MVVFPEPSGVTDIEIVLGMRMKKIVHLHKDILRRILRREQKILLVHLGDFIVIVGQGVAFQGMRDVTDGSTAKMERMKWDVQVHVSHMFQLTITFRPRRVQSTVPLLSDFTAPVARAILEGPVFQRAGSVMAGQIVWKERMR